MSAKIQAIQEENIESKMFDFGKNWAEYARHIDDLKISKAREGLLDLFGDIKLEGKTFLDIGCGSGLHALAALQCGIKKLHAMDIDADSVATARAVIEKFSAGHICTVEQASILDKNLVLPGPFDIVYSWGVLHHTGDMWAAIRTAAAHVAPKGYLVIALYKKTPLCGAWKIEKKIYNALPEILRRPFDGIYALAQICGLLATGRNPVRYIRSYPEKRGMRWMTDIRDWLGGTPYQSASPAEVKEFVENLGFRQIRILNDKPAPGYGVLGTGCAEYVFEKVK